MLAAQRDGLKNAEEAEPGARGVKSFQLLADTEPRKAVVPRRGAEPESMRGGT